MKKIIFILFLMPLGLMAQKNTQILASAKSIRKVTLTAIEIVPTVNNSPNFDFKKFVRERMTVEQFDACVKNYKYSDFLVPNAENEIVQVRVNISGDTPETKYNRDYSFDEFRDLIYAPLPASASITITITDNGTATLVDIRDVLCQAWGYGGNPNDSAAKLAFLKQVLINKITNDYNAAKTVQLVQSIQVNIN